MFVKLSKKSSLFWLYVAGAILLLVAAWLWCFVISTNPERVFWRTLDQGLSSHGVTVHADQAANGTDAKQLIRFSFGANNLSHSVTTLSQQGTEVRNETIGTPTADYSRYVSIKTSQKKADGSPIDFSKLLGTWTKGEDGSAQYFAQAVFGGSLPIGGMGIPMGYVSSEARSSLVKQIQDTDAYKIDFSKTKKKRVNGRMIYTYEASVRPVAYVTVMKQFAKDVGLHGLDQLDPENFKSQPAFKLEIQVDAKAHHVIRITAPESKNTQSYSGHDVPVQIEVPKKTITPAQLQQLLSDLQ